jgi:hypothetical protein
MNTLGYLKIWGEGERVGRFLQFSESSFIQSPCRNRIHRSGLVEIAIRLKKGNAYGDGWQPVGSTENGIEIMAKILQKWLDTIWTIHISIKTDSEY